MELGKILHAHRKWAGLSQMELARIAGVGKTVVYDMEKGKTTVRLDTLMKVCRALNITLTWDSPFRERFEKTKE
jgi:y4mF family transcriptional regulator